MHTIALRLAPWRAEMLSDRILPTLPTAEGAAPASFSAEREREIANARARLQMLRQNLALAAAFRVTFSDGEEAVVPWPGPGFARRSQDGELLIRIACAADGKVSIATAPGVAVSAEFTAETKSASAARQVFWQTLKGDPLPRHWTIASDPTARKLIIPLVAFSGARIGPDPTDFPVALTDTDSGWSFAGQLVEQTGQ